MYVVPLGESDIDATVQADVASELHDVADVRFADERSEALDEDEPGMPVRDDGVLVAIGDVAERGRSGRRRGRGLPLRGRLVDGLFTVRPALVADGR